jgi:pimeloyl-ACP methyl ester carboxylesterase
VSSERVQVAGRGLRLSGLAWRGGERCALLLHGAAGYAGEWSGTASWLSERCTILALDLRGHAGSERRPEDASLDALVEDAGAAARELGPGPVLLVGQSLGGMVAIAAAARHPDLFDALVVVEAGPAPDPAAAGEVAAWLVSWPVPFASRDEAATWFGDGLRGEAWADGLATTPEGLVPQFEPDVVVALVRSAGSESLWDDWRAIRCPTLIARGEHGLPAAEAEEMARENPSARLVTLPGAGHDAHLEAPAAWREALERFLDDLSA